VIPEVVVVTSPDGGEEWVGGTTHSVTWTSTGNPLAKVKVELLKAGVLKATISSSVVNSGSYSWVVPATQALGSDYSVRVTSASIPVGGSAATDSSDASFAVIAEVVAVTSPNGGESWLGGTVHELTWTSTGSPAASVKVELLKAGVLKATISSSTPNDGSFTWTIPATQALGSDYSVRVTRTTAPSGSPASTDSSNSYFSITK
jgi:5-hydroxyisourate hydrolase-like protein (transthyretin family)